MPVHTKSQFPRFSYAASQGALGYYHVFGLHELKNSEATIDALVKFGGEYTTLQDVWIRRRISFDKALQNAVEKLLQQGLPVGLEVDVDAIQNCPSSASTAAGVPLIDGLQYVDAIARGNRNVMYLHLAEGAPRCHPAGEAAGAREIGAIVSELAYTYIQARIQSEGTTPRSKI